MYQILYKTVNNINGKQYIGIHQTNNLNDGYIGCGIYNQRQSNDIHKRINSPFAKAVYKHGYDNFTREILCISDSREYIVDLERRYVDKDFINRADVYNAKVGGNTPPIDSSRDFYIRYPNGDVIHITNLTKWCRENKCSIRSMYASLYEKRSLKNGYSCSYENDFSNYSSPKSHGSPKKGKTGAKPLRLENLITGEILLTDSIRGAARMTGIDASWLSKKVKSKNNKSGDWKIYYDNCRDLW